MVRPFAFQHKQSWSQVNTNKLMFSRFGSIRAFSLYTDDEETDYESEADEQKRMNEIPDDALNIAEQRREALQQVNADDSDGEVWNQDQYQNERENWKYYKNIHEMSDEELIETSKQEFTTLMHRFFKYDLENRSYESVMKVNEKLAGSLIHRIFFDFYLREQEPFHFEEIHSQLKESISDVLENEIKKLFKGKATDRKKDEVCSLLENTKFVKYSRTESTPVKMWWYEPAISFYYENIFLAKDKRCIDQKYLVSASGLFTTLAKQNLLDLEEKIIYDITEDIDFYIQQPVFFKKLIELQASTVLFSDEERRINSAKVLDFQTKLFNRETAIQDEESLDLFATTLIICQQAPFFVNDAATRYLCSAANRFFSDKDQTTRVWQLSAYLQSALVRLESEETTKMVMDTYRELFYAMRSEIDSPTDEYEHSSKESVKQLVRLVSVNQMSKLLLGQTDKDKEEKQKYLILIRQTVEKCLSLMTDRTTSKQFMTVMQVLDRSNLQDKQVAEMIVDKVDEVNEFVKLSSSHLRMLNKFMQQRQHVMAVKTRGVKKITHKANALLHECVEPKDGEVAYIEKDYISLMTLAGDMRGYDYEVLNEAIVKQLFKKSFYQKLTIDKCMMLLKRGYFLELKTSALEKLELYMLDRIMKQQEEYAATGEKNRFNENRVSFYLQSLGQRRRLSLVQIQCALRFIDHFFDIATVQGTQVRQNLRKALGQIDTQSKAEFVNERKAIIGFLKRDPTLTEDELVKTQEDERDHLKLQQEIQDYFKKDQDDDAEFSEKLAQYDSEMRKIDEKEEKDEEERKKEQFAE